MCKVTALVLSALVASAIFSVSAEARDFPSQLGYCANDQTYRVACGAEAVPAHANKHHARPTNNEPAAAQRLGLCHIETAGGPITIACGLASQMKGFIGDAVARGFRGRIKCFSLSKSHVARSLHFIGEACDFAQRGWGKTVRPMYRVADLAAKWGLRDGCTFADCGHIDSGRGVARKPWPVVLSEMKQRKSAQQF